MMKREIVRRAAIALPVLMLVMSNTLATDKSRASDDSRYDYVHAKPEKTTAERAKIHKITPIGQATFKQGVTIAAFAVSIQNPMEDGLLNDFEVCSTKTCSFNFTVPPDQAKRLSLYWVAGVGPFLAPKAWKTIEAGMGPSGIASLMMSDANGDQVLTIYNTSACVGCALSAASRYFPEAKREAIANEFMAYTSSNIVVNKVSLNKDTVAFSYQLPAHYQTHGIAKFYGMQQDIVNYNQMSMTLMPKDKALASTILNFYNRLH